MSRQTGIIKNESQSLTQPSSRSSITPACDVYENKDEILIIADVPGVAAEALKINLEKGELTLAASREEAPESARRGTEWTAGEFRRRFLIPSGVDASKISAELKDGVMRLHLPKSADRKPRQIEVRVG